MTVAGDPPRFVAPLPDVVTTRGGEYLWMPGLAALRTLGADDSPTSLRSAADDRGQRLGLQGGVGELLGPLRGGDERGRAGG